jgi:hypothetical protein
MKTKFVKSDGQYFKLEDTPDGGAATFLLDNSGLWKPISVGCYVEAEFYGHYVKNPFQKKNFVKIIKE